MKKAVVLVLVLAMCTIGLSRVMVRANTPPPSKNLAERIELATHIIIGTAKKVTVVEFKDGKPQAVIPQPTSLDNGQTALIELDVESAMYPAGWQPKPTITYLFGGGLFSVMDIRNDTLGKRHVYLMRDYATAPEKQEKLFHPSYPWNLFEALQSKPFIQAVVNARLKRESEAKTNQTQPQR